MGSATREAVAAAKAALAAQSGTADLATGEGLLAAGRSIGGSRQLLGVLADPSAEPAEKAKVVDRVFSALSPGARSLLVALVGSRWSSADDLLGGIEEIALRVIASSAPASVDIPAELFSFGTVVSSNAELELAVGRKLGDQSAKADLLEKLLAGKASKHTVAILTHLVQQPRGRRIGALLRHAADIVADQAGLAVATVTVAAPMSKAQLERLRKGLATRYGALRLNQVVDPSLIGGVRVAVGDEVIDDSVASRLNDLRLQLAG